MKPKMTIWQKKWIKQQRIQEAARKIQRAWEEKWLRTEKTARKLGHSHLAGTPNPQVGNQPPAVGIDPFLRELGKKPRIATRFP